MEILRVSSNVKCDMPSCAKTATFAIGGEGVLPRRKIYFCSDCAKMLYEKLAKELVPKSPQNHIKQARDNQIKQKSGL